MSLMLSSCFQDFHWAIALVWSFPWGCSHVATQLRARETVPFQLKLITDF